MMDTWIERKLARVERAEDLFGLFLVDFDPHVLAVHRVGILRDFGAKLKALDLSLPALTEQQRMNACARVLQEVYGRRVDLLQDQEICPQVLARIRGYRSRRGSCNGECSAMTQDRTME